MRILLATDGSPCSEAAIDEVARRPWPDGTEVRIVSVAELSLAYGFESPLATPAEHAAFRAALVDDATAAVATGSERLRAAAGERLEVSVELLHGNPKKAIVQAAERWQADLIVLGSHGYQGVDRLLLGSVSQAVASRASCTVEIVRPRNVA